MRTRSCLRARFVAQHVEESAGERRAHDVEMRGDRIRTRIGAARASRSGKERRFPRRAHETEGDGFLPAARDEQALDGDDGADGLGGRAASIARAPTRPPPESRRSRRAGRSPRRSPPRSRDRSGYEGGVTEKSSPARVHVKPSRPKSVAIVVVGDVDAQQARDARGAHAHGGARGQHALHVGQRSGATAAAFEDRAASRARRHVRSRRNRRRARSDSRRRS